MKQRYRSRTAPQLEVQFFADWRLFFKIALTGDEYEKSGRLLHAAQIANSAGIDMVIANGADPDILYDITDGKPAGTRFISR